MSVSSLVLTVVGADRPGLVRALSESVALHNGSWVEARMTRLAGQFAGVVRVDVLESDRKTMVDALNAFNDLRVQVTDADGSDAAAGPFWIVDVVGNDRTGIVRDVTSRLSTLGANVEDFHSECASAPMSGTPLFKARVTVSLPDGVTLDSLRAALEDLSDDLIVDIAGRD